MIEDRLEDVAAELIVAGCAVASARGSWLAHERLDARQFTRPYLRRLFEVSPRVQVVKPSFEDAWELSVVDRRVRLAAELAEVDVEDVARLVATRPVLDDTAGGYAARVVLAWQRRLIAAAIDDAREALRAGISDARTTRLLRAAASVLEDPATVVDLEELSSTARDLRAAV